MSQPEFAEARRQQAIMIRRGRSFSGHERNCAFLNLGTGRFADISATSGFDFPDDGRAVAIVDWDHDGDLDLWVSNRNAPRLRLLRNDASFGNRRLSLKLVGNGDSTNRDAIGARVEVIAEKSTSNEDAASSNSAIRNPQSAFIKSLRAGEGFLAQSSKWLHFGLGDALAINRVIVHWPGGAAEEFSSLDVDASYELVQGSGRAERVDRQTIAEKLHPSSPEPVPPTRKARIPLVTRVRMPRGTLREFATGRKTELPLGRGRPMLLNIWASSCESCVVELAEFTKRASELKSAGIDVVALCVDKLDEASAEQGAAEAFIRALEFPFLAGHADRQLISDLQLLHDNFILRARSLPVPSSFLIDGDGRVSVIYKGPVAVDQLIADAALPLGSPMERFRRAAAMEGRIIDHDLTAAAMALSETAARMRLARNWLSAGRYAEATSEFSDLVAMRPDSSPAHYGLGDAYLKQSQLAAAIAEFRDAIRLSESSADAHFRVALALEKRGSIEEAIAHYRRGLELEPSFMEGANNLAWLLATNDRPSAGDGEEALRWAEKCAAATEYKNPGILDSLAAAYANEGRFTEAIRWQTEAIRLAPSAAQVQYRARLTLYQAGQPYRALWRRHP